MVDNRTYGYLIKEIHSQQTLPVRFQVPSPVFEEYNWGEQLIKRAAYVHFYGEGGWQCLNGWPLTFTIYITTSKLAVTEGTVFILNGQDPPEFEVC